MSTIPDEEECIAILVSHLAPGRIIRHVCTVTVLAVAMAERCGADVNLVRAGGLLHDLGRTRTHGIAHGVEGERMARELGLPEVLALIIRKHVGAGIAPAEARTLGLPDIDMMPSTVEEKIVCHADNLVRDAEYLTSAEAFKDFVRKGLKENGGRMMEMHDELSSLCGMNVDTIAAEVDKGGHRGPCGRYLDKK